MNILILEDEIPAYEKLKGFAFKVIEDCHLLGWARSVSEAKKILKADKQLDLVFSDIELLDGNSFQIFEEVPLRCPIIFCTSFDQYMLKAFKTNGIAYLLKPYTLENFQEAYDKYLMLFNSAHSPSLEPHILSDLRRMLLSDRKSYKQRFVVKKKQGIKLVETKEVIYFEAKGDFCVAIDKSGIQHIINQGITEIEEKIDPSIFFRINRGQLVNIAFIEKIEPHFKNRLAISMKQVPHTLLTSSTRTAMFRKWLDK